MSSISLDEMPQTVKSYSLYMRNIKGRSANTVNEYCLDLRTFFRFMKKLKCDEYKNSEFDEIPINDIDINFVRSITTVDIFEFMNYAVDNRTNIASTRQRKTSSIRGYFKYLCDHEHLIDENPTINLTPPKKKKALPKYLSLEQSRQLLAAIDGPDKERDFCMITLFLNCGMRLSELVGINITDVIYNNSTIRILGKGNKERIVYLNDACISAIANYLKVRPKDKVIDKNALFLSNRLTRISPKTVQHIVNKYLDKIGLGGAGYSVHKLRHTAATLMYQYGDVDIRVLQDILGHENLGTTEIYTHTSSTQIEEAMKSNPLSTPIIGNDSMDDTQNSADENESNNEANEELTSK